MSPMMRKHDVSRKVDYEDVDDVIGIAAEMMHAQADMLSVQELEEVARELEIPAEFVARAVSELDRRREARSQAEAVASNKRKKFAASVGAVVGFMLLWMVLDHSMLSGQWTSVEQAHAQVVNVIERQQATEARYAALKESVDKDAELAGSENRVRIERRRYDEAAGSYNARVRRFPTNLWISSTAMPKRAPMSNEVEKW